jgi:benzylsuccinate CoA-transferase BbsE subunit
MPMAEASPPPTVLDSIKVLDWTDQGGAYAARLLADLGADVVRVEPVTDEGPWPQEPVPAAAGTTVSAFERFVNLNKRSLRVNQDTPAGRELLGQLAERADIVLTAGPAAQAWRQSGPRPGTATQVNVSAFGRTSGGTIGGTSSGAGTSLLADDLVTLAAGGLLSLGGYPDREPVAVYGSQAYLAGGISAAIAALLGVLAADAGEPGADLDVSTQAVMASALEDAAAEFDLTGVVRRRTGDGLREAGTGTFRCADGWIVVVAGKLGTAAAWDSLTGWLCDQDVPGAEALKGPEWTDLAYRRRPESIAEFQPLMESATGRLTRAELYEELQLRRIAAAPVNNVADLLADPQLADRAFFRTVSDPLLGRELSYPGPPYRLEDHRMPDWTSAPVPGGQTDEVLRDWLGIEAGRLAALRADGVIR